uniref:Transmembrane protein, putative n=1 Tax=Entamoeba invadens TaxID=33085 RepID=S0B376_ENTIV|nr:transmembrane protein, putative [Entamoeba invadens]
MEFIATLILSVIIPGLGMLKKSLTIPGAIFAFATAMLHFAPGLTPAIYVSTFFITSSALTKVGKQKKKTIEATYAKESVRGVEQVFCNSLIPSICCLLIYFMKGTYKIEYCNTPTTLETLIYGMIPGFYSCTNGDTWSSEIGVLSKTQPFHLTLFKRVPTGTNGGVSLVGVVAGLLGSLLIGTIAALSQTLICGFEVHSAFLVLTSVTISGVIGNFLDSLIGGTLQYSGWDNVNKRVVRENGENVTRICGQDILSNSMVNLITSTISGAICATLFVYFSL